GLVSGKLRPQSKNLIGQLFLLRVQFVRVRFAELFDTPRHCQNPPARVTNFVGIGSLCAARSSASRAVASSIPAISNMIRPGFTGATQRSGAPLPLPMRVSAGFLVKGSSGKIGIETLRARLMKGVIAGRDASSCRSVDHAAACGCTPYAPKAT